MEQNMRIEFIRVVIPWQFPDIISNLGLNTGGCVHPRLEPMVGLFVDWLRDMDWMWFGHH